MVYISFPQLETKRFRLRELRLEDAEAVFRSFSNPEVMRYYDSDPFIRLEQAVEWIATWQQFYWEERGIRFGIAGKDDDQLIGTIGFHSWEKNFFRAAIGYESVREFWGQGVMSEVLSPIIAFGFEQMGLNRIEALVDPRNLGSVRVLEKQGFQKEGLLQDYLFLKGAFVDAFMLALLKKNFFY